MLNFPASVRRRTLRKGICFSLLLITLLVGCVPTPAERVLPTPVSGDLADAASAQTVMAAFLSAWQDEDYAAMYGYLTALTQDAISLDEFESTYRYVAKSLTLEELNFKLLSGIAQGRHAEVAFQVDFQTLLLGNLSREMVAGLSNENGNWQIQWDIGLILPELVGGNWIEFHHKIPSRGRIFDRFGAPLAAYENAIAVGLVPGEISPDQAERVYETLAEISFYEPETLAQVVAATPSDWYLPVITLNQATIAPHIDALRGFSGVRLNEIRSRFYVDGGVAPHALGYMLFIPEEELETYQRMGYRQDERIGRSGLEASFERELSGERGGSLYLMGPNGNIQSLLAASDSVPGQSIHTTLDKDLQMRLQASFADLRGAAVVMEVDSGRILALVSNPHFDPNAFDLTEIDRSLMDSYFTDPNQPLFNRATQGQYPLGSVFKTVSMAAALEAGIYRPGSMLNCGHSMWVCNSVTLYDWTLGYGTAASGDLNLVEGLMRSCNPWFYRIGEVLFNEDLEDFLPEMAFGFGLSAPTGIDIPEAPGNIPATPGTCVNNAQIAIGQGEVLVTPLQVATFFAALANGGDLYRPTLVERIQPATGEPTYLFSPEPHGQLPVSEETLAAIQEGLRMVVDEMRGTGYWAMQGLNVPVSGKTGTAETPTGRAHAWFAGYSRLNDPQRPDIAVVVLVENGGEGSQVAAPIFRRAVALYFSDYEDTGGLMPWEVEPYVPYEPEPSPDEDSPNGD